MFRDKIDPVISEKLSLPTGELIEVVVEANLGVYDRVFGLVKSMIPRVDLFRQRRTEELIFKVLPTIGHVGTKLPLRAIEELAQNPDVNMIWDNSEMFPYDHTRLRVPHKSEFGYPKLPEKAVFYAKSQDPTIKRGVFAMAPSFYVGLYCLGTDLAYNKGYYGSGVKIGIVDSGIDLECPSFAGADVEYGRKPRQRMNDVYSRSGGHGTMSAAAIVGQTTYIEEKDDPEKRYRFYLRGSVPRATAFITKAFNSFGHSGFFDLEEAMIRAVAGKCDILSISMGGKAQSQRTFSRDNKWNRVIQEEVMEHEIICVNAAGNAGPISNSVCDAVDHEAVIAVGAYNPFEGKLGEYSSRGPTSKGLIKPDCVGPAGYETSTTPQTGCSGSYDGTSASAPIVAGVIALACELWRTHLDRNLETTEIIDILIQYGHEKNNNDGYGPLWFKMFWDFIQTEYGIVL